MVSAYGVTSSPTAFSANCARALSSNSSNCYLSSS